MAPLPSRFAMAGQLGFALAVVVLFVGIVKLFVFHPNPGMSVVLAHKPFAIAFLIILAISVCCSIVAIALKHKENSQS